MFFASTTPAGQHEHADQLMQQSWVSEKQGIGIPCKLFVGGLPAQTTTEALREHFARYGRIIDAVVMSKSGRPRGFGFVTYDSTAAGLAALSEAQYFLGRLVDVKRAVPGERPHETAPSHTNSNKVFVGGLPQDVSTKDLKAYFSRYGMVADAVVMVDRRTNRSRGFGFVRFSAGPAGNVAAEAVMMDFAIHCLAGKWIEVKRATPAALLQEGTSSSSEHLTVAGHDVTDGIGGFGFLSPACDGTPPGLTPISPSGTLSPVLSDIVSPSRLSGLAGTPWGWNSNFADVASGALSPLSCEPMTPVSVLFGNRVANCAGHGASTTCEERAASNDLENDANLSNYSYQKRGSILERCGMSPMKVSFRKERFEDLDGADDIFDCLKRDDQGPLEVRPLLSTC